MYVISTLRQVTTDKFGVIIECHRENEIGVLLFIISENRILQQTIYVKANIHKVYTKFFNRTK